MSTLQVQPLSHKQVIYIHPLAPVKPDLGESCNGCGICCLVEPCPLGVLLSRSRNGPCKALAWADDQQLYRCGALIGGSTSKDLILGIFVRIRNRVVARWIASGKGCDCDLDAIPSSTISNPMTKLEPPAP